MSAAALREPVADLVSIAQSDLDRMWAQVHDAVQAREALLDVLPALVDTYGSAAATIAADYYDEERDRVGAAGRYTAEPADTRGSGADKLARWGIDPLFADEPDWALARTLVAGGLQKRIANASRATITGNAARDSAADGWQRVARPNGCAFCQMIAGRGAVYSEETVDFSPHDDCHCFAEVAWRGRVKPVRPYTPTEKNITDADRARVRAWIAANL